MYSDATTSGARIRPEVVGALVDCWNNGSVDVPATSAYDGPVLLRGARDPFVTREMGSEGVEPRFPSAHSVAVDGAGHWPFSSSPPRSPRTSTRS